MGPVKFNNPSLKSIGISMVGSERGARGACIDIMLSGTAVSVSVGEVGGCHRAGNQVIRIALLTLYGSSGGGGATGSSRTGNHPIGILLSVAAVSL